MKRESITLFHSGKLSVTIFFVITALILAFIAIRKNEPVFFGFAFPLHLTFSHAHGCFLLSAYIYFSLKKVITLSYGDGNDVKLYFGN